MFWFVFLAASAAAFILSYGFVNRYLSFKTHKNSCPFVLLTLLANMFVLLSITYLLPLDVFYSAQVEDSGPPNDDKVEKREYFTYSDKIRRDTGLEEPNIPSFVTVWSVIYWLEFVISWFIFPVLISYLDLKYLFPRRSDEPSRRRILRRIREALICNIKFYGMCAAGIVGGLIYLKITTNRGFSDFKPLVISLTHLYSLLYMLVLLATGLVSMPKSLLLEKNDEIELFVKLSQNNDDLNDAKLNMTDNAERILSISAVASTDEAVNQVIDACKREVQVTINETKIHIPDLPSSNNQNHISLKKLNDLYNDFISAYYNYVYHQSRSDTIIHTLVSSQSNSTSMPFIITKKAAGAVSLLLSLLIVLLEVTPTEFAHSWLFWGNTWKHFGLEMTLLIYCTLCSLFSLSKFKFQNFHIIPNGNSNPRNTLYYSLYSSRLLVPLCFNFITLIPRKGHSVKSGFEKVLYKELEVISLVNYLNLYLPIITMIFVPIFYYFNLKEKILLHILGEEYYYEFFGMNYDTPVANRCSGSGSLSDGLLTDPHRTRIGEDLEYSLQDGRYLFERATNNYVAGSGANRHFIIP
ncbi:HHL227Cp [Eremothecium sinecaudum]|uniref:HHL227Cp n=1 Tax=Eremothecium sinecaudum TaxID=45286 RepID=A0A109V071_9SACH|nr:HHL227Cp [Eremothecium sinecaudum]AMD22543.1 HHL227Cp [Eremothecium sinecaudum]